MRLVPIKFPGYPAGATDFEPIFENGDATEREALLGVIERIADQIIQGDESTEFTAIVVVGHSDRQDRSDMNCDQKRASEIAAARDRAVSAWEFVKLRVTERLAQSQIEGGEWWDTSPRVTWAMVFAAAGMLQHDPPASEAERLDNRRVMFLVSMFTSA